MTKTKYQAFNANNLATAMSDLKDVAAKLGGTSKDWKVSEVGDGNLNLVFIVEGPTGSVVVKQALPYVRLVGESWPLPLDRAYYEHAALKVQNALVPGLVPSLYHFDRSLALIVMEHLTPHIILRKGLIGGTQYPKMAKHMAEFLAKTLFHTSDLALPADDKKKSLAKFASNIAMCKITEDLVFTEPYYNAPMNKHTTPDLDNIANEFQRDTALKIASQELKHAFLSHAEALIHGDLHTGSIMVTETDTRAIDPEFAFFGPMGFDIGALIANLLIAFFSQKGHATPENNRLAYADWILWQVKDLWNEFAVEFTKLFVARTPEKTGDAFTPVMLSSNEMEKAAARYLQNVWQDTLGFAGMKIIRRILGLAHVADFETIAHQGMRAACENRALAMGRMLAVERANIKSVGQILEAAKKFGA